MKTETLLLLGGAAVLGYLYARHRSAQVASQPQALAMQQPVVAAPPEAYDVGYVMPAWTWGGPVWGAGSWGGFRGHGGHHGGHGGHH